MSKRGAVMVFIMIIGLVVALVVAIMLPFVAKTYASGEIAFKKAAARDIALTIDLIYAYPPDMEFEYGVDLSNFVVEISQNKVKVDDESYDFVSVKESPDVVLNHPNKIIFKKENDILTIT